jgi:hypothetical protein
MHLLVCRYRIQLPEQSQHSIQLMVASDLAATDQPPQIMILKRQQPGQGASSAAFRLSP